MKTFQYVIKDELWIHARPAGQLVKLLKEYASTVTIAKGDKKVEAIRLMAVMGLGVKHGDTVTIEVEGPDEKYACEAVEKFFQENL